MQTSNLTPKLNLNAAFMTKVGRAEIALIEADTLAGITQNKTASRTSRYSQEYKEKKARGMRRLTRDTKGGRKAALSTRGYYITKSGQKIYIKNKQTFGHLIETPKLFSEMKYGKLYAGIGSVVSTETSFKNYQLTGMMLKRLFVSSPKMNEVTVGYNAGDTGKILGARDHGDELVGLNDRNIETIKEVIATELSKGIDEWAKEDIRITIKI